MNAPQVNFVEGEKVLHSMPARLTSDLRSLVPSVHSEVELPGKAPRRVYDVSFRYGKRGLRAINVRVAKKGRRGR